MSKDEILNSFILETGRELDYWLLEENSKRRELEIGSAAYAKIAPRMIQLRSKFLKLVLELSEELK